VKTEERALLYLETFFLAETFRRRKSDEHVLTRTPTNLAGCCLYPFATEKQIKTYPFRNISAQLQRPKYYLITCRDIKTPVTKAYRSLDLKIICHKKVLGKDEEEKTKRNRNVVRM
jgi:hypothetical protein